MWFTWWYYWSYIQHIQHILAHIIGGTIYDTYKTLIGDTTYGDATHTTGDTIIDFISGDGFEPIKYGIHHEGHITTQQIFSQKVVQG